MNLPEYFQAVDLKKISSGKAYRDNQWFSQIDFNPDNFKDIDIAILDVSEDRGSKLNKGCNVGANQVRQSLYKLYKGDYSMRVADLGTIPAGNSLTDTYFALQETLLFLFKNNVIPVVLGGSRDLSYAIYLAYTKMEQLINIVSIDAYFSLGETDDVVNDENYLSKILLHQPNALFNFSNLGYQTYFVDQKELGLLDDLFFDIYRLGLVKENIKLAEPIIRNADFLSFSMNAVAQAHSPANNTASPNGFSAEQACQLARYAGMNEKLSTFSLFDFNGKYPAAHNTADLMAQMIWYFVDGFYHRKGDFPIANKSTYIKYNINLENQDLIFYKSQKTDRWWMEIPYLAPAFKKYEKHLMLPCNYDDYLTASANEIPERWFQTFKKLK